MEKGFSRVPAVAQRYWQRLCSMRTQVRSPAFNNRLKGIQRCCRCGIGCNWGLDSISDLGISIFCGCGHKNKNKVIFRLSYSYSPLGIWRNQLFFMFPHCISFHYSLIFPSSPLHPWMPFLLPFLIISYSTPLCLKIQCSPRHVI